jgi:hypothetical protein
MADAPIVPLGALRGFSLPHEVLFVSAYYGLKPAGLRRRSTDPTVTAARAALCWRLVTLHGWPTRRAGAALGVTRQACEQACAKHAQAIALFRSTHGIGTGSPPTPASAQASATPAQP